ncbi:NAD(P)-dependent oxidoreductase [Bradyrhizobium sp. U87765 SZCCT0131]|nr:MULTISPECIES: NAD(P)-dependent oxidoreductase [unclassified Bradyrhizobium]MBR1221339.1 NAD(P)-dependent oxidoreductase [Bradyrhizobium sp. U87765 SZCCT0131]MBR1264738.1 NAD(P)-dependent oxidoreductase [Bradyrhizobium sp. U87765 SZCCT0134]MBR1304356.1 NAD(P)-dependent oxidoreductase [Bradyrhizobium sp. U87765 SZCCT0110]MBR1322787.1 NAD(P)-dependent oxidoreductase [Bradyrhizobium sp. U87765 SZCCT0109]MBR1346285.1 NAD(P)-dependent oxidoreductase [Bradyrhizobium sp. U87765 SZCCT0048]
MKVGVAGLGRMGAAIAARLMEVGHEVTVWNRSADKTTPLASAGAAVAASPAELASTVEAVLTILTDADAIAAVYDGPSGILAGSVAGKLVVDMSTVQSATAVALAARVRAQDAVFVECPVGGTVGPAKTGKLLGLAGAAPDDFARAQPLLAQLCRRVDRVGPVGAGASMKLAINLPLGIFWQAFGEAYALCRHLDLDPAWLVELFADTSGGPNVLKARGGAVAEAFKAHAAGAVTFDCDSIRKDFRTMVAEAQALGFDLPLAERTLAVYDQASREGWGGRDCTELPAFWASRHAD